MASHMRIDGASQHRSSYLPGHGRCWGVLAVVFLLGFAVVGGCIERTVSINSEPEGATVVLNDQEVGQTPVKVPFTWYGDYDIIIRKSGYQTIQTNKRLDTPWYEIPGIDLFTECLVPFTVHDDRYLDTFVMEPAQRPTKEALLQNAAEMKERALASECNN